MEKQKKRPRLEDEENAVEGKVFCGGDYGFIFRVARFCVVNGVEYKGNKCINIKHSRLPTYCPFIVYRLKLTTNADNHVVLDYIIEMQRPITRKIMKYKVFTQLKHFYGYTDEALDVIKKNKKTVPYHLTTLDDVNKIQNETLMYQIRSILKSYFQTEDYFLLAPYLSKQKEQDETNFKFWRKQVTNFKANRFITALTWGLNENQYKVLLANMKIQYSEEMELKSFKLMAKHYQKKEDTIYEIEKCDERWWLLHRDFIVSVRQGFYALVFRCNQEKKLLDKSLLKDRWIFIDCNSYEERIYRLEDWYISNSEETLSNFIKQPYYKLKNHILIFNANAFQLEDLLLLIDNCFGKRITFTVLFNARGYFIDPWFKHIQLYGFVLSNMTFNLHFLRPFSSADFHILFKNYQRNSVILCPTNETAEKFRYTMTQILEPSKMVYISILLPEDILKLDHVYDYIFYQIEKASDAKDIYLLPEYAKKSFFVFSLDQDSIEKLLPRNESLVFNTNIYLHSLKPI